MANRARAEAGVVFACLRSALPILSAIFVVMLRVAVEPVPHAQTVTLGCFVGCGSRFESSDENGITHFIEHMAFKGTPTRRAVDIDTWAEDHGVRLDAYTNREMTCFFARLPRRHLDATFELFGDVLTNSEFRPSAIERERATVLAECEVAFLPAARSNSH